MRLYRTVIVGLALGCVAPTLYAQNFPFFSSVPDEFLQAKLSPTVRSMQTVDELVHALEPVCEELSRSEANQMGWPMFFMNCWLEQGVLLEVDDYALETDYLDERSVCGFQLVCFMYEPKDYYVQFQFVWIERQGIVRVQALDFLTPLDGETYLTIEPTVVFSMLLDEPLPPDF